MGPKQCSGTCSDSCSVDPTLGPAHTCPRLSNRCQVLLHSSFCDWNNVYYIVGNSKCSYLNVCLRPRVDRPWSNSAAAPDLAGTSWEMEGRRDLALRGRVTLSLNLSEPQEAAASLGQGVRKSSMPRAGTPTAARPWCPSPALACMGLTMVERL